MKILNITIPVIFSVLGLLSQDSCAEDTVAKYTFDGRAPEGKVVKRPYVDDPPFNGEDYVPDGKQGEVGPRLINVGGGGDAKHYRSYYNHAASKLADGREVLELKIEHPHRFDIYQTPEEEGPLPADGSFTWEVVCRIDGFDGTNRSGVLIDASKGAGRIPGTPGLDADKAITTRLWMKQNPENQGTYALCFSVPVNDQNKCATATTELQFGDWHHFAAVYDDNKHTASLYIDGKKVASEDDVVSAKGRSSGFGIGGYGPDVFRVDHLLRTEHVLIDAIAFSDGALGPNKWALKLKGN